MSKTATTTTGNSGMPSDIADMPFEKAMAELELIVQRLESGKGGLDDAIAAFERGAFLRLHCDTKLSEAKARIEKIIHPAEGTARTAAFDETA